MAIFILLKDPLTLNKSRERTPTSFCIYCANILEFGSPSSVFLLLCPLFTLLILDIDGGQRIDLQQNAPFPGDPMRSITRVPGAEEAGDSGAVTMDGPQETDDAIIRSS